MSEEYVFKDLFSNIIEAEVKFTTKRKLDKAEEQVLENEFMGMVFRVGSALYTSQVDKDNEGRLRR